MAVDNGDLSDHTPYTKSARSMLNGMCTAFYKVKDASKKCTVSVETDDGILAEIEI